MAATTVSPVSRVPQWAFPAALGVAGALATAYTAWQDPNADGVFPQCPTRTLFGVDCPGCGGLRAVHALTHGDVAAAFGHNVLVPVLLVATVALWARWLLRTLGVAVPRLPKVPRSVWAGVVVLLVAFTVVRNIGGVAAFEYLNSTT